MDLVIIMDWQGNGNGDGDGDGDGKTIRNKIDKNAREKRNETERKRNEKLVLKAVSTLTLKPVLVLELALGFYSETDFLIWIVMGIDAKKLTSFKLSYFITCCHKY